MVVVFCSSARSSLAELLFERLTPFHPPPVPHSPRCLSSISIFFCGLPTATFFGLLSQNAFLEMLSLPPSSAPPSPPLRSPLRLLIRVEMPVCQRGAQATRSIQGASRIQVAVAQASAFIFRRALYLVRRRQPKWRPTPRTQRSMNGLLTFWTHRPRLWGSSRRSSGTSSARASAKRRISCIL